MTLRKYKLLSKNSISMGLCYINTSLDFVNIVTSKTPTAPSEAARAEIHSLYSAEVELVAITFVGNLCQLYSHYIQSNCHVSYIGHCKSVIYI